MAKMPTYFISHGGGPWPWIPPMRETFKELETSLVRLVKELPEKPKAILMISGHWETPNDLAVMASPNPPMYYDYYGFPEHTYKVVYPASGDPELADRVKVLLDAAGQPTTLDTKQGFDHGVFAPMAVMYPEADIPLIQLSMHSSYDPERHFAIGRALAPLRDEGVVIIGSGLSFHNLKEFGPSAKVPSAHFDAWLSEVVTKDPEARTKALINWEEAPYARFCHKDEDHFVPIFVALGAAEDGVSTRIYHETGLMGGITSSSFRFD